MPSNTFFFSLVSMLLLSMKGILSILGQNMSRQILIYQHAILLLSPFLGQRVIIRIFMKKKVNKYSLYVFPGSQCRLWRWIYCWMFHLCIGIINWSCQPQNHLQWYRMKILLALSQPTIPCRLSQVLCHNSRDCRNQYFPGLSHMPP